MSKKQMKLHDKIQSSFVTILKQSSYYEHTFLPALNKFLGRLKQESKISDIICYGLGSFHEGTDLAPRFQLALLIALYHHLRASGIYVGKESIDIYDPSFTQPDKDTLQQFVDPKFNTLDENEHCARNFGQSSNLTLIYMPHLDGYLYNNLLGANWDPTSLPKLVILGNSFQAIIDQDITARRKVELCYVFLLASNFEPAHTSNQKRYDRKNARQSRKTLQITFNENDHQNLALIEEPVSDGDFEYANIFNELAFHAISAEWLDRNSNVIDRNKLKDWEPIDSTASAILDKFDDD